MGDLPEAEVVERIPPPSIACSPRGPRRGRRASTRRSSPSAAAAGARAPWTPSASLGVRVAAPGPTGPSAPTVADADRMVLAELAAVAHRANVTDVAEAAYAKLAAAAPGSTLLAVVDDRIHGRAGVDAVKAACEGGLDRSSAACLGALLDASDRDAVLAEIKRLRRLRRAPDALRDVELRERVARGDLRGALAVYDAMPPGQRAMLEALGLAAGRGDARAVRGRLARDRTTARDTPAGIGPITRALGLAPDPAPALEAEGRKLVLEDQQKAFLPGAATAVLRHVERFTISPDGLVHYVTYDLRRVSGTTDVAQGTATYGPLIEGRAMPRLLRRRIHKRDGRILAPDAASNAAQDQSDPLSSSRATTSSRSPRATRCRATAASSSSTRGTCSPSARASARRRSRSAARRRSRSRSGRTRCSAPRSSAPRAPPRSASGASRISRRGAWRTACLAWRWASASAWGRRPGTTWPLRSTRTSARSRTAIPP